MYCIDYYRSQEKYPQSINWSGIFIASMDNGSVFRMGRIVRYCLHHTFLHRIVLIKIKKKEVKSDTCQILIQSGT